MRAPFIIFALCVTTAVLAGQATFSLEGSYILPVDDPAIRYHDLGYRNAIVRLKQRLAAGDLQ
jgi:hypothetical protein